MSCACTSPLPLFRIFVRHSVQSQYSKIDGIWSKIYPVGSIYMSTSSADPRILFGGTWQQITGRFLLAAGGGYSAGATGGEATHKLTVAEMPSHNHTGWYSNFEPGSDSNALVVWNSGKTSNVGTGTGGNAAHNNMPPYLAVYTWKRIA